MDRQAGDKAVVLIAGHRTDYMRKCATTKTAKVKVMLTEGFDDKVILKEEQ
jgi:hypothetical protein